MNLTIVIPVKNEQGSIKILYEEILTSMSKLENISYEIFFVDDGSKDESWGVIEHICKNDKKVKGFKFIKNYGKSVALNFCFRKSDSDILITMDADLQDDPSEIPNLIEKTKLFDCVVGWKKTRNDPLIKTVPSKIFNFFNRKLFKINLHDINCGFKAYKKEVYKKLVIYGELHRFIPILVHDMGFSVTEIEVNHRRRVHGSSKYGFERFLRGFLDFLTVAFTTKFYQRPNHFFGGIGIFLALTGILIFFYLSIKWMFYDASIFRPLFFLSLSMVIVGIQVLSLGIMSEIILKSSNEKKKLDLDIQFTQIN